MPLRDALGQVEPYRPQQPMEDLRRELGLERIVKLGSNEGAFGPLPAAAAAFEASAAGLGRYPDGSGRALRDALAEKHGVPPQQIVLGAGADELIRFCGLVTLEPGGQAVFPWPSFPSYGAAAACSAAEAVRVPLREHAFDLEAVLEACLAPVARVVFLANPNNPTGTMVDPAALRGFVEALPDHVLCVLDEAYAEYAHPEPPGIEFVRAGRPRMCVLRTFSKVYGLAALRIGYAVASPEVADVLDRVRPIFNVNQPAQEAALAALGEGEEVARRVAHARSAREWLLEVLAAAGLDPVCSQANFVHADVPGGDGAAFADRLLREGVIVRALGGFGAPGAIRVTCGTDEENELFAAALARV